MSNRNTILFGMFKTTLVMALALGLAGCLARQAEPPLPGPGPAEAETTEAAPVWTEERVTALFTRSEKAEGAILLDCVLFPDMAYDMAGAVLYTDAAWAHCGIAYVNQEGFVVPTGLQSPPDPEGDLTYLGEGTVLFSLDQEKGPVRHLLSFSSEGPDLYWELVSEEVAPEEFEGLP